MNRQLRWIQDIEIVLGWPSNMGPWIRDHFFSQFWKLGFCSVSKCPISAHRGRLCKFLVCECVASVPTWNLPKNACTTHWKPFLMHSFHSMPQLGIQWVSLKAYGRWDSTFHILMTVTRIDEPLDHSDSGHWDSSRVSLYSRSMDKGSFFFVKFGN